MGRASAASVAALQQEVGASAAAEHSKHESFTIGYEDLRCLVDDALEMERLRKWHAAPPKQHVEEVSTILKQGGEIERLRGELERVKAELEREHVARMTLVCRLEEQGR